MVNMNNGAKQLRKMFERPDRGKVAKRIGIGRSYLSLLETGKRVPSMTVAARIQKELGIPVEAWTR